MKLQRHSGKARAQLSSNLLAYSAAAATVVGASTAQAQITLDENFFNQTPNAFGGSFPALSMGFDHGSADEVTFSVGNASFALTGGNWGNTWQDSTGHSTPVFGSVWVPNTDGTGSHKIWTRTRSTWTTTCWWTEKSFSGGVGIRAVNANFAGFGSAAYLLGTASGHGYNAFGGSHLGNFAHNGLLAFSTIGGGVGRFDLHLGFGSDGVTGISLTGGEFTAVPESSSVALGLGLIALGFAGVREHRRRRAAAATRRTSEN